MATTRHLPYSAIGASPSKAVNPQSEPTSDSDSSNLDTIETSGDCPPPESYRNYCLDKCSDEYDASYEAYDLIDDEDDTCRSHSLHTCRTLAWFCRNVKTGKVKILSSSCKLRWCPMCSSTRRWFLTKQVPPWVKGAVQPKFLTLTLKHTEDSIHDQIEHLYNSFKKFRKLDLLKRNIRGGIWFFQIHKSTEDDLWHPHLHCVIDSPWIDKYEISTAWELVTKTSKIINIKEVKDADSVSEYVARYAARPSILANLAQSERVELIRSLHGRRLVGTWGTARTISLRPSKPLDSSDWAKVGSYEKVVWTAKTCPKARAILKAYKDDSECPPGIDVLPDHLKPITFHPIPRHFTVDDYQMKFDFQ